MNDPREIPALGSIVEGITSSVLAKICEARICVEWRPSQKFKLQAETVTMPKIFECPPNPVAFGNAINECHQHWKTQLAAKAVEEAMTRR